MVTQFRTVRRGYDPEQVEVRITELEQEVANLRSEVSREPTLADAASDRVQRIVAAAEDTAQTLTSESEEQARLTARKAEQDAQKARQDAEDQAANRIGEVNEAADHLQGTSERLEQSLEAQLDDVRVALANLTKEVEGIRSNINHQANSALNDGRITGANWRSSDVQEFVDLPGDDDAGPTDTDEAVQLVAQNMAENGSTRDETAEYLTETFGVEDPGPFVEEAYGQPR